MRQLELSNLKDPRYKGALCAIETAKDLLGRNEDEIGEMVDSGQVVAFDIRTPDSARRDLRVLKASIVEFNQADAADHVSSIEPSQAVALVMADFKHDKPFLSGKEIGRVLNCGRQHRMNLFHAKALNPITSGDDKAWRRGPNGSPRVSRAEFCAWLTSRIAL